MESLRRNQTQDKVDHSSIRPWVSKIVGSSLLVSQASDVSSSYTERRMLVVGTLSRGDNVVSQLSTYIISHRLLAPWRGCLNQHDDAYG